MANIYIYIDESGLFGPNQLDRPSYVGAWVSKADPDTITGIVKPIVDSWMAALNEPSRLNVLRQDGVLPFRSLLHWGDLFRYFKDKNRPFPEFSSKEASDLSSAVLTAIRPQVEQFFIARGAKNYYAGPQDLYTHNLRMLLHGLLKQVKSIRKSEEKIIVVIAHRIYIFPNEKNNMERGLWLESLHRQLIESLNMEFFEDMMIHGRATMEFKVDYPKENTGLCISDLLLGATLYCDSFDSPERKELCKWTQESRISIEQPPPDNAYGWWERVRRSLDGRGPNMDLLLLVDLVQMGGNPRDASDIAKQFNALNWIVRDRVLKNLEDALEKDYKLNRYNDSSFECRLNNAKKFLSLGVPGDHPIFLCLDELLFKMKIHRGKEDAQSAWGSYRARFQASSFFSSNLAAYERDMHNVLILLQDHIDRMNFEEAYSLAEEQTDRYEALRRELSRNIRSRRDALLAQLVGTLGQIAAYRGDLEGDPALIKTARDLLKRDTDLLDPKDFFWPQGMEYRITLACLEECPDEALALMRDKTKRSTLHPADLLDLNPKGSDLFKEALSYRAQHGPMFAYLNQLRLLALLQHKRLIETKPSTDILLEQVESLLQSKDGNHPRDILLKWILFLLPADKRPALKDITASFYPPDALNGSKPSFRLIYSPIVFMLGNKEERIKEIQHLKELGRNNPGWELFFRSRYEVVQQLERGEKPDDRRIVLLPPFIWA